MLCYPNVGRKNIPIGAPQKLRNPRFFRWFLDALTVVRRTGLAPPIDWHKSMGTMVGNVLLRIIHTLDALGAAWHRDLFLRHGRKPVADNWHGFIPHGRREGPSLVLQAVIVRPAAIVRCVLVTLLDMANAFGSTHFEAMRRAVAERPQSGFFTNWRESATIVLAGCDGKITMRPNRGGLMGERNEPDFFGEVFAGPIGRWSTHTRLHMDEGKALWSTSPIDGRTVDL